MTIAEISQSRSVTPAQAVTALSYLIEAKMPTMLWGQPGIGKSDIVRQICARMGGKMFDVRLSNKLPEDLAGIPFFCKEENVMKWAHPVDMPTKAEASLYPIVFLFLDEITSASPELQSVAFQLLLDRRIGTYSLPDNCVVIGAGNRQGDRGVTHAMSTPLKNRLCHLELRVDFDSWLDWALNEGNIHPDIIGFLLSSKQSLNDFDPKSPANAFATSRSWSFVSRLLHTGMPDDVAMNVISGLVGEGMAITFMSHRASLGALPLPEDVIFGRVTEMGTADISAQYSLMTSLMYELKERHPKMMADGKKEEWHLLADNVISFMMKNYQTEMQVCSMQNALIMGLPIDLERTGPCKDFMAGPGQLILKAARRNKEAKAA